MIFESPLARIVIVVLVLLFIVGRKFGLRLPAWFRWIERIAMVLWIAVALYALLGALLYFQVIKLS